MEEWEKSTSSKEIIALIACSKTKASNKKIAKEMYQGALFKKAIKYCSILNIDFFILSAKYGLISPDKIIEPYNLTLTQMKKDDRKKWADKVKKQMIDIGINKKKKLLLAGIKYIEFLDGITPLKNLSQGFQLQWFDQKIKSLIINKRKILKGN